MIEFNFNQPKSKRYLSETSCYGPKSCWQYALGELREVPYKDTWLSLDDKRLDSCLTGGRGKED